MLAPMSFGTQGSNTGFLRSADGGEAIELPGWSMRVKVTAGDSAGRLLAHGFANPFGEAAR